MRGEKSLLTVLEVASRWGMGRSFVYSLVLRGELGSIKLGKNRRIPLAEVERFEAKLISDQLGGAA